MIRRPDRHGLVPLLYLCPCVCSHAAIRFRTQRKITLNNVHHVTSSTLSRVNFALRYYCFYCFSFNSWPLLVYSSVLFGKRTELSTLRHYGFSSILLTNQHWNFPNCFLWLVGNRSYLSARRKDIGFFFFSTKYVKQQ